MIQRAHHAAPTLSGEQGRETLRIVRTLQETALKLDPQHARAHADTLRRKRVVRLSLLVYALETETEAGVAIVGHALSWWPT